MYVNTKYKLELFLPKSCLQKKYEYIKMEYLKTYSSILIFAKQIVYYFVSSLLLNTF